MLYNHDVCGLIGFCRKCDLLRSMFNYARSINSDTSTKVEPLERGECMVVICFAKPNLQCCLRQLHMYKCGISFSCRLTSLGRLMTTFVKQVQQVSGVVNSMLMTHCGMEKAVDETAVVAPSQGSSFNQSLAIFLQIFANSFHLQQLMTWKYVFAVQQGGQVTTEHQSNTWKCLYSLFKCYNHKWNTYTKH